MCILFPIHILLRKITESKKIFFRFFLVFMIDAYRIIMSIYTSYTCYYIFSIKCFQYFVRSNVNDKHRVVNKLMWLHFLFISISRCLSISKYICTKQLMIVCTHTLHCTTIYISLRFLHCFPRIIFILFRFGFYSLHWLEVFSVPFLIIELVESMHCSLCIIKMQCNDRNFRLFLIFDSAWIKVLISSKSHLIYRFFPTNSFGSLLCLFTARFDVICLYVFCCWCCCSNRCLWSFFYSISLYFTLSLFSSDFRCLFVCLQKFLRSWRLDLMKKIHLIQTKEIHFVLIARF